MAFILCSAADAEVRRISGGRLQIVEDACGIVLLDTTTGERAQILERIDGDSRRFSCVTALSKRERQVLELLADGTPAVEIAERLGVSVKTVETYRARIKDKFELRDGMQLFKFAVEWKLAGKIADDGRRSSADESVGST